MKYGPTLPISQEIHATKYRLPGEPFEACCDRLSSTLSDNDDHRHALSDIFLNQRFMPAGRVQAAIGSPRQVTPWNCLTGDTLVLTKEYGLKRIDSLSEATVLDGNRDWVKVKFNYFGKQKAYSVRLTNGKEVEVISATADHGWVTPTGSIKTTAELRPDDRIGFLSVNKTVKNQESYSKGVVHGLVYGDGNRTNDNGFQLRVCDDHDDVVALLAGYPCSWPPSYEGDPIYYFYGENAWADFKEFPDTSDVDYLLGFIRGWFAADGCVSTQPEVTVCGDDEERRWLSQWGPVVGFYVKGYSYLSEVTNYGRRNKASQNIRISDRGLVDEDFLISRKRKRFSKKTNLSWRVSGVTPHTFLQQPLFFDVYCPSVPTTNSFSVGFGVHSRNCFVSGVISDDFNDIMEKAKEAGQTMRLGGGIGYDFSTLRPAGSLIKSLGSSSSGPVSFMDIYDSICGTISSAGHRRGAQMGVLRVDHPDIEEFVYAKRNSHKLTRFNISVGVTDPFMKAVKEGTDFNLKFRGKIYKTVNARALWDSIMRSTWDWAEPGVLFIDRINEYNNLWYCEQIAATNPCQPGFATVLTPEGIVSFDDIDVGSIIWSGSQWTKVISKVSTGVKQVYEYVTNAGKFVGTENHRIVQSGEKVEVSSATAIDLSVGPTPIAYQLDKQDIVDGWVLGDGSVHKASNNLVLLYLGEKDAIFHDVFSEFVVADRTKSFNYGWEVQTTLTADNLPKTYDREVPLHIKQGSITRLRGFLRGLYSANGSICGKRVTLKAASRKLVEDVQEMLSALGISSYITTNKKHTVEFSNGEYECRESYDLNIGKDIREFAELIGFVHPHKHGKLAEVIATTSQSSRRKTTFDIVEIRDLGMHPVYDITVDADEHTYWTGGVLVSNCGEQPLPPYGACLLGSFNLVKYVPDGAYSWDYDTFRSDIKAVVRAMDNIIDIGIYPLPQQEQEGKSKRRMGLGVTGLANALERLGMPYGSPAFIEEMEHILTILRDTAYQTSVELAKEKGAFPLYDERYLDGKFIKTLPESVRDGIKKYGIRNSHLLSIAPTGTISLSADNISSGIEPVYTYAYTRTIQTEEGVRYEDVEDYGYRVWGVKGKTANELSPEEHVNVLIAAQKYIDSSCSKTCNVGADVDWERFKSIYMMAYDGGAKGCTTFRAAGKRMGILNENKQKEPEEYISDEDEVEETICRIDETTGQPSCS